MQGLGARRSREGGTTRHRFTPEKKKWGKPGAKIKQLVRRILLIQGWLVQNSGLLMASINSATVQAWSVNLLDCAGVGLVVVCGSTSYHRGANRRQFNWTKTHRRRPGQCGLV